MENNGSQNLDKNIAANTNPPSLMQAHWKALVLATIGGIVAMIGLIMVIFWYIEYTEIGLHGTATFDQWTLAWVIEFVFKLILWILLIVGLPVAGIYGLGGWLWWSRLPEEEKQKFRRLDNDEKKKHSNGSGGFSFVMFIAYCIYISRQSNFHTPFGNLPYSYWIYAYIWTFVWFLIIVGIPMAIGGIIYLIWYKKN